MKNYFLILLFAGKLFATTQNFDTIIENLRTLTEVPGAAVAIVVDDKIILSKGYGTRNGRDCVTTKTLFQIGSASKAFTTFVMGQLVDERKLDWDDPVCAHIPYFRLNDPYTTYHVTLRDYLTHVSGYPRHEAVWFNETHSRAALMKQICRLEPVYALREKFIYQNLGYMIAGHAAERAAEKRFEDLVTEKIFKPLGMNSSTFSLSAMQKSSDFSLGYESPSQVMQFVDPETISPAGGIHSNIEDLTKWLQLLLKHGEGLIEPTTFAELITPQVVSNLICNGKYGVENEITMESYGLGWILISYRGHFVALHGGNIDGFSATVAFLPREGIGLAILSNRHFTPFAPLLTTSLLDKLLNLPPIDWAERYHKLTSYTKSDFTQYKEDHAKEIKAKATHSHLLADYQGVYHNLGYGDLTLKIDNGRLVACYNKMLLPLDHWHYDVFEVASDHSLAILRGMKFAFQENSYGDIASVSIPLEPQGKGIVFMKKQEESLFEKTYLDQFIGKYTYLGFTFVVENAEDKLTVKAFGQPPYDLIPEKANLFKVKGMDGYTVQFVTNESGEISAIQLVQPNNSVYVANKI